MKKISINSVRSHVICSIFLCLTLFLSSCTVLPKSNDSQPQHIMDGNTYGYYLDVFSAESKDKERTGIIEMASCDEELFAEVESVGQNRTLMLQVYIDYQQIPIMIGGIEYTSYILEADEDYAEIISFNLSKNIDTTLNHKMLVVLVAGADVFTSQTEFELSDQYAIALDYTLSFADDNALAQSVYPYTEFEPTDIQSSGILLNTDFSGEEISQLPERKVAVNAGECFDLQLSLGGYENVSDVAVIISIGQTQAKINQCDYIIGEIQDGRYSRSIVQLTAPDTPGLYEVMGWIVKDPFSAKTTEWLPCDMSYRFTIEVL